MSQQHHLNENIPFWVPLTISLPGLKKYTMHVLNCLHQICHKFYFNWTPDKDSRALTVSWIPAKQSHSQWQHSFQLKAALPLAERLAAASSCRIDQYACTLFEHSSRQQKNSVDIWPTLCLCIGSSMETLTGSLTMHSAQGPPRDITVHIA